MWARLVLLLSMPVVCLCTTENFPDDLLGFLTSEINSLSLYPDDIDLTVTESDGTVIYASPTPKWITSTTVGYDRYQRTIDDFSYGSLGELEYAQTTTHPFVQLLWLPNVDRFHTVFHKMNTFSLNGNGETVQGHSNQTIVVGRCAVEYAITEVKHTTDPQLVQLHFILYKDRTGNYLSHDESTPTVSSISLLDSPSRVLVGAILLARTKDKFFTSDEAENITSLLAAKICDKIADIECCVDGEPGTNSLGEDICICDENVFGACCDKECANGGHILNVQPHNSEICKCDYGFGGPECTFGEGAATHFVTVMGYDAEKCQNKITGHIPYTYNGNTFIDSLLIAEEANKVQLLAGTNALEDIIYGTIRFYPTHNYYSTKQNDFLMGVEVPFDMPSNTGVTLFVKNELQTSVVGTHKIDGFINIRSCDVKYHVVQRNGTSGSLAEIFFVVGITGQSTFNSSQTGIQTGSTSAALISTTTTFSLTGTVEGILIGYTFVASGKTNMSNHELVEVVKCYALQACDSLTHVDTGSHSMYINKLTSELKQRFDYPYGCVHGKAVRTNGKLSCVCNEGFVGPKCKYPC